MENGLGSLLRTLADRSGEKRSNSYHHRLVMRKKKIDSQEPTLRNRIDCWNEISVDKDENKRGNVGNASPLKLIFRLKVETGGVWCLGTGLRRLGGFLLVHSLRLFGCTMAVALLIFPDIFTSLPYFISHSPNSALITNSKTGTKNFLGDNDTRSVSRYSSLQFPFFPFSLPSCIRIVSNE